MTRTQPCAVGKLLRRHTPPARLPFAAALLVVAALSSGCVDRRFIIESDVPGAIVYENGKLIGPTPAVVPFTYYGTYRFQLVRDGYQTLTVDERIRTPWYEYFPLDFIVENLLPYTVRDIRYIRKTLEPEQIVSPEEIRARAEQLRAQGQTIGTPLPPRSPGPPVEILPPK